jgi:hypothetical protein
MNESLEELRRVWQPIADTIYEWLKRATACIADLADKISDTWEPLREQALTEYDTMTEEDKCRVDALEAFRSAIQSPAPKG